jgi:hypothetical protein
LGRVRAVEITHGGDHATGSSMPEMALIGHRQKHTENAYRALEGDAIIAGKGLNRAEFPAAAGRGRTLRHAGDAGQGMILLQQQPGSSPPLLRGIEHRIHREPRQHAQ